jgi:uncharacterized membrane protein YuzA (DUF378 family)
MTELRKLRVFICHASQDKPIARDLYQRLRAEGWLDPWLDQEKLIAGRDWGAEIEEAVRSADAVIVNLSNSSVKKEGYIQKELRFALDVALEKPEDTVFIIPLRLDECFVPRSLRSIQYIDYFPPEKIEESYARLLASLEKRAENLDIDISAVKENSRKEIIEQEQERVRREVEERISRERREQARKNIEETLRREAMADERKRAETAEKQRVEAENLLKKRKVKVDDEPVPTVPSYKIDETPVIDKNTPVKSGLGLLFMTLLGLSESGANLDALSAFGDSKVALVVWIVVGLAGLCLLCTLCESVTKIFAN